MNEFDELSDDQMSELEIVLRPPQSPIVLTSRSVPSGNILRINAFLAQTNLLMHEKA